WTSSDALIAELELARMSPSIMELISKEDINNENARFGINLVDQVCKMMLENIMKLKNENADEIIATNDLREWQRQVTNILSLSANIETSSESKTLQFLRICNDLISTQLISISDIVGAINVKREPDPDNQEPDLDNQEPNPDNQEPNSDTVDDINTNTNTNETQPELDLNNTFPRIVDRILEFFENIPSTERVITSQCSFFRRCFDIIPFDSPVRIHIYEILFGREPRVLLGSVLSRALMLEENLQPGIFIQLIQNARATLIRSPTLTAINTALGKSGVDSPIMALCCDVMQNDFFAKWDIKNLVNSYRDAINVLCSQNFELLQLVIAVALLKEFVNYLWSSLESVQNTETEPMMFNDEIENIDEVIDNINLAMERQSLLIRSLKLYFLRDLYVKGLSLHGIKCFCEIQRRTFPWLTDFDWSESNSKINFVAYRCYNQYIEAEEAFTPLYKRGQHMQFEQFLNRVSNNLTIGAKMSIIGILITRLYDIRAIREPNINEENAIQWLRNRLPTMQFDQFYIDKLLALLEDANQLYSISPETSQTELLIRSVIVHTIALYSCIPAASSPLAAYLQTLRACKDTYILASRVETDFLLELTDALGNFTRHCGYKYIVGECGRTMQESNCPRCGHRIGGLNHTSNPGNTRLDAQVINGTRETITQLGYVYESIESRKYINYRLRDLTPVFYRILHLFVHILIAAASDADRHDFFNNPQQQNNEIIQEPLVYCQSHIENDWQILTRLFDCDDETLAFVLHSILHSISENPNEEIIRLDTVEKRRAWENEFAQRYINPKVVNARRTATDFQKMIKDSQRTLESEINETLDIDERYQLDFRPRIWRRIGKTSFENLHAFCVGYPNFTTEFPFLSLFFEYQEQLILVKNLVPIVKFSRILSSMLCYRLKRSDARNLTFERFLKNNESPEDLYEAFENFTEAWNSVREHVVQFECHEFKNPMPEMTSNLSVVYALFETKDESLYLCGAIEFLTNLQNEFLQQVLAIEPGCPSLRFLEGQFINNVRRHVPQHQYYIESLALFEVRSKNIINYEWDSKLLSYSQCSLELGHGQELQYELPKIEAELAYSLLFNKVHLNKNDSHWLDVFPYHQELFSTSRTILSEIRELIPQEQIPPEKHGFSSMATYNTSSRLTFSGLNSVNMVPGFDNPTELLSELEILLCFLRRISGDREMKIVDYLNKWLRLSALTENPQFQQMVSGLRLKHVVALYELVEEKIADIEIEHLSDKYKAKISQNLKDEINAGVDFEQSYGIGNSGKSKLKIPQGAFALVLKRFMFRYLSSEMYNPNEVLVNYLAGDTLIDCWPVWVPDNVIRDKFPKSLLAANIYDAYQYTIQNVKKAVSHKINSGRQKETSSRTNPSSSVRSGNHGSHGSHGSHVGRKNRGRGGSSLDI
ncbi:7384_t:CDS:2, partial [Racocetra persica]